MINREIVYERNLTGSFMKIPACLSISFDEKVMLKRKLPGLLPVEKCFVNNMGQYWYNITGKQSVDTYCRMKEIGIDFIERMIISICSQIEILEWNLVSMNCLMLDPELVYINNQTQEIIFTLYPDEKADLGQELQHLMEYLLTKIDHKDMEAVHAAYAIYEKTLNPAYSVIDIRDAIVEAKRVVARERVQKEQELIEIREKEQFFENSNQNTSREPIINRFMGDWRQKFSLGDKMSKKEKSSVKEKLFVKEKQTVKEKPLVKEKQLIREPIPVKNAPYEKSNHKDKGTGKVKYGKRTEESIPLRVAESPSYEVSMHEEFVQEMPEMHPTVCLSNFLAKPQGILLYEGMENLEHIHLTQPTIKVGQGKGVDVQIKKGTISHFHARIDQENDEFFLEDLNSTNGTFLNGEGLNYRERRKLAINDIVQFADVRYRFI